MTGCFNQINKYPLPDSYVNIFAQLRGREYTGHPIRSSQQRPKDETINEIFDKQHVITSTKGDYLYNHYTCALPLSRSLYIRQTIVFAHYFRFFNSQKHSFDFSKDLQRIAVRYAGANDIAIAATTVTQERDGDAVDQTKAGHATIFPTSFLLTEHALFSFSLNNQLSSYLRTQKQGAGGSRILQIFLQSWPNLPVHRAYTFSKGFFAEWELEEKWVKKDKQSASRLIRCINLKEKCERLGMCAIKINDWVLVLLTPFKIGCNKRELSAVHFALINVRTFSIENLTLQHVLNTSKEDSSAAALQKTYKHTNRDYFSMRLHSAFGSNFFLESEDHLTICSLEESQLFSKEQAEVLGMATACGSKSHDAKVRKTHIKPRWVFHLDPKFDSTDSSPFQQVFSNRELVVVHHSNEGANGFTVLQSSNGQWKTSFDLEPHSQVILHGNSVFFTFATSLQAFQFSEKGFEHKLCLIENADVRKKDKDRKLEVNYKIMGIFNNVIYLLKLTYHSAEDKAGEERKVYRSFILEISAAPVHQSQ